MNFIQCFYVSSMFMFFPTLLLNVNDVYVLNFEQ